MARGFLSEGSGRRERDGDGDVTVDLELAWSTDKAFGFRQLANMGKPRSGGSREELVWVPREIRGEPVRWAGPERGSGKLTGPRWLLEQKGLL